MCEFTSLTKVLELTPTPPGNECLSEQEIGIKETKYPLDLYFCEECSHLQLGHVVDPEILYQKNYTYVSGTSPNFVNHHEILQILDYLILSCPLSLLLLI